MSPRRTSPIWIITVALAGWLALAAAGCASGAGPDRLPSQEELQKREEPKESRGM
jgi:hypothetical protein